MHSIILCRSFVTIVYIITLILEYDLRKTVCWITLYKCTPRKGFLSYRIPNYNIILKILCRFYSPLNLTPSTKSRHLSTCCSTVSDICENSPPPTTRYPLRITSKVAGALRRTALLFLFLHTFTPSPSAGQSAISKYPLIYLQIHPLK